MTPAQKAECSAQIHIEHYFPKGYDPNAEPWKSIRTFHNEQLATAKNRGDAYWEECKRLQFKLRELEEESK